MRIVKMLASTSIASLAVACSLKSAQPASNEAINAGSDSASTESNVEALSSSFVGSSGSGSGMLGLASGVELTGGDSAPQALGDAAKAYFQPSGCLVVTDQPAQQTATYAFNGCTGPYGLVKITGTVTVDYSSSAPNQLTLKYAAQGLKINNATIDSWTATADVTANGLARDMTWNAQFTGTTARGRTFSRTNSKHYQWTAGTPCLSVSGTSDGTVTGRELKTDIKNWTQCAHACPEAGSEITITDVAANQVYDLKYNDTDAVYTGPNGNPVTFTPACAL